MRSVKFKGFTSASQVALTAFQNGISAQVSTGPDGWGSTGMNNGGPISIVLTRSQEQVAPDSVGFAVDLSGATFDTQPPTGGVVYDDQFHDLVYYWDFGDPGTWTAPVNVLPAWKNRNVGYGPFVKHMYRDAGTYTIGVTVIEPATGKISTASASVTVADPDTVFSGTSTIVLSDDPSETTWTGAPAGAQQFTDFMAAVAAYEALPSTGRLLFKRGGDFQKATDFLYVSSAHVGSVYFGAWGTGNKPILRRPAAGSNRTQVIEIATSFGATELRDVRLSGLNFIGEFDSTTTLGDATQAYRTSADCETIIDDCRFSGWDQATYIGISPATQRAEHRTHINDTYVTDYQNYPVFFVPKQSMEIALTGTAIVQHVDAIWQQFGGGGSCRINTAAKTYIAGCDIFSSTGRSGTLQPCLKWEDGAYADGQQLNMHNSSLEGGLFVMRIGGNPNAGGNVTRRVNALIDKCIFAGSYNTQFILPFIVNGMTFRNNLVIMPAGPFSGTRGRTVYPSFGPVAGDSNHLSKDTPNKAYSNTYVMGRTFAENGTNQFTPYAQGVPNGGINLADEWVDENNVYYAPNYTPVDVSEMPLDTSPTLFQLRSKGKWELVGGVPTLDATYAAPTAALASYAPLENSAALGDALTGVTAYDSFLGAERPIYPSRGASEMSV